jgi:hypothetical protein
MRPISKLTFVCLVGVLFVTGCSSSNKGKIEGTKWTSQASTVKGQAIPAGFLQLEFRSDGSMVYKIGPQNLTGKYSLGSGSKVTLNLDKELAGRKSHVEKVAISGEQLTMTDGDGTQMTFQKVK